MKSFLPPLSKKDLLHVLYESLLFLVTETEVKPKGGGHEIPIPLFQNREPRQRLSKLLKDTVSTSGEGTQTDSVKLTASCEYHRGGDKQAL